MNQSYFEGGLQRLPQLAKSFLVVFIMVMSFGYGAGLVYLNATAGLSSTGVEEQYLGNEADEEAEEMKFKKSEKAILTLVHGHVISFGLIFFTLGGIFLFSSYSNTLKGILTIEPLISTVTTFGGIWIMWYGVSWFKYVLMVSGAFMHLSFVLLVVLTLRDLLKR